MKSTSTVRNIDPGGRITIPMSLRKKLDIKHKDEMDIYVEEDKIILVKREDKK